MAKLNSLLTPAPPRDFVDRMNRERPGVGTADPGMVVQPPVDPGYAMPNISEGNLVQPELVPGMVIEGWLPAGQRSMPPQNALLIELLRRYGL